MTREEIIECFDELKKVAINYEVLGIPYSEFIDFINAACSALIRGLELEAENTRLKELIGRQRYVTVEQVESWKKVPIGGGDYEEWWAPSYTCPECGYENPGEGNFCQDCGCPFTDEAVEAIMNKLEALKND